MWVVSELGSGSEFHFTVKAGLPSKTSTEDGNSSGGLSSYGRSLAALATVSNNDRRVLVAEDNPANRMVARMTLEKFGFRVYEAGDGTEALDAAQRLQFDVVLMDCRMPGMDGYEATRQIRRLNGPAGKVPIIALTASAFKEDRIGEAELVQKCFSWVSSPDRVPSAEPAKEPNVTGSNAASADRLAKYPADFLRSLMEIFLETAPPVFQRLVTSIEKTEWEEAKTSAHWLRGGAARVIAPDLQEQLDHIEYVCSAEIPELSTAELENLTRSFSHACQFAEKWLEEDRIYCTSS
jgi:CheY-like chemotaxis protein